MNKPPDTLMKSKSVLAVLLYGAALATAVGQPTVFTYQGRLSDNGAPASGTYELRFVLHTASSGPAQIGPTLDAGNVNVNAGNFAVSLDFGPGVFTGAPRWLEIAVRTNGSVSPHVTLSPRQQLTSAPYAAHAGSASNLLGSVTDSQLSANISRLNANQNLTGTTTFNPLFGAPFVVGSTNTNRVVWLNADLLDGFDSSAFAHSNHTHSALDITGGTLNDARLSANVPRLNSNHVFTASNRFAGIVVATNASNTFAGTFAGTGAGLSNLNAAALTGAIPQGSIPASVAWLGSNQSFSGAVTFSPGSGAPFRVGSSTLVTNLNADQLDGLSSAAFWNLSGNNNASGTAFLGTVDNSALELRANNARAMRLIPGTIGASVVAGSPANGVASNISAAAVLGGLNNTVSNNYGFIGGGSANRVGAQSAAVLAGDNNTATGSASVVPGGTGNLAGGVNSFAAGNAAQALHNGTFVWADFSSGNVFTSTAPHQVLFRATGGVGIGTNNPQSALHVAGTVQASGLKFTTSPSAGALLTADASGNASWQQPAVRSETNATSPNIIGGAAANSVAAGVVGAAIGGGGNSTFSNHVAGNYGTVAGGFDNRVLNLGGVIGGGFSNAVTNDYGVIGGGVANVSAERATVAGGQQNVAGGIRSAVGGGLLNRALGQESAIAGGVSNIASGLRAFVGGGDTNVASGSRSVIAGGEANRATNAFSTVGGGFANTNHGLAATISGGQNNAATNNAATVPGGSGNVAGGQYSFAAGRNARALHDGAFVWSDASSSTPFSSTAPNQFTVRAAGGVGINTNNPFAALDVAGEVRVSGGGALTIDPNELHAGTLDVGGLRFGNGSGEGMASRRQPGAPNRYGLDLYTFFAPRLSITQGGNVGIGTNAPQQLLSVAGGAVIDQASANIGDVNNSLRFGSFSGEAIGSKRTPGANQYGLDFYTAGFNRMTILNNGRVGIGTLAPNDQFEITGFDTAIRIKNNNDSGLGGFIENTFGSLQFGMFSESNTVNQVPAAGKRAFFGFTPEGRVGSLVNDLTSPSNESFRNLLDDGAGHSSVAGNFTMGGVMSCGAATRQMLNLWNTAYGIGVQSGTMYFRTDGAFGGSAFAWYKGGMHNDAQYNSGGGSELMRLNTSELLVSVNDIEAKGAGNEQPYFGGDGIGSDVEFGSLNSSVVNAVMWNRPNGDRLNLYVKTLFESSDRNLKEGFADIDAQQVLAKVVALPIQAWHFRGDETNRHIGPTAQDFRAAFGLGRDDKSIANVDANGVALAAIQGMSQLLCEKEAKISKLEKRIAELEKQAAAERTATTQWQARLEAMELRLSTIGNRPGDEHGGNSTALSRTDERN